VDSIGVLTSLKSNFGNGSVWTQTQTPSEDLEPLKTLVEAIILFTYWCMNNAFISIMIISDYYKSSWEQDMGCIQAVHLS
jgi:hypothetical protein